ncbi:MAG: hypothetical protein IJT82_01385 [Schwartzia sp.]|nr:hypothetical protein [Schwartzia sp. (in: firmicutes)]
MASGSDFIRRCVESGHCVDPGAGWIRWQEFFEATQPIVDRLVAGAIILFMAALALGAAGK